MARACWVFSLPAFTRLGHERQDFFSPCDGMHVFIPRFILSSERVLGGMESEPMLTPRGKNPPPEKISPKKDQTHDAASSKTASFHYQGAIPARSVV